MVMMQLLLAFKIITSCYRNGDSEVVNMVHGILMESDPNTGKSSDFLSTSTISSFPEYL
jgi:hypothetical protein